MKTHIALLRGINVSGQKKIKMAEWKTALEELGLVNVQTYIQSGNVVFESTLAADSLEHLIHQNILEKFGFDVEVFVFSREDLMAALANNPFAEVEESVYFVFLKNTPPPEKVAALKQLDFGEEKFEISGRLLWFYPPKGYGKAKLNNNLFEKKLGVTATTRNFNTMCKLIEMAGR